jgi:hypothetical protein
MDETVATIAGAQIWLSHAVDWVSGQFLDADQGSDLERLTGRAGHNPRRLVRAFLHHDNKHIVEV